MGDSNLDHPGRSNLILGILTTETFPAVVRERVVTVGSERCRVAWKMEGGSQGKECSGLSTPDEKKWSLLIFPGASRKLYSTVGTRS